MGLKIGRAKPPAGFQKRRILAIHVETSINRGNSRQLAAQLTAFRKLSWATLGHAGPS